MLLRAEREHWVDASGAASWDVAGEKSYSGEKKGDGEECCGVAGVYAEEKSAHQASEGESGGESDEDAAECERHSFADDEI